MASNKALVPVLVGMMCLTGVTNTILTKLQDKQCVAHCDSKHPKYFEQPVLQSFLMFIGEAGCWLVILISSLLQRYVSKGDGQTSRAGYSAVAASEEAESTENADDEEDEERQYAAMSNSQTLVDPTNLPAKALIDGEQSNKHRERLTGWKVTLLALPAICDIIGTTLMNVGLLFVAASIFQMTRGALVLFVGLLSVIFLKRRLGLWKWTSLFIVVGGVAIVGLAGVLAQKPKEKTELSSIPILSARLYVNEVNVAEAATTASQTLFGVVLIAAAQIFAASQFVLEESIMERYVMDPIQVVSWEGTFGLIITGVGMGILHAIIGRTPAGVGGFFDAKETFHILFTNRVIGITSLVFMFSIAGFNFFGLSVTRHISATARSTIDTFRVLFIWLVSLGLGWESFKWLQVLGFAMLVYGTGIFNEIISPPSIAWLQNRRRQSGPVALHGD